MLGTFKTVAFTKVSVNILQHFERTTAITYLQYLGNYFMELVNNFVGSPQLKDVVIVSIVHFFLGCFSPLHTGTATECLVCVVVATLRLEHKGQQLYIKVVFNIMFTKYMALKL